MLLAVRGNKQLQIDDASQDRYLALGYDIAEVKEGKLKIVKHAPNKTVPYTQYEKLLKENEELKAQLAQLTEKASTQNTDGTSNSKKK